MKLAIIVGTTRRNRQTPKLARWVERAATVRPGTEVRLLDLADYPMPFFDEPISPRYNPERRIDPVAQRWLSALAEVDAYIVVTPEYNHSIPGVLKNAFDYVDFQMERKPSAIVSHGTVGGARAAMHLKEILSESHTVPIPKSVAFAGLGISISDDDELSPELAAKPHGPQAAVEALIDELGWYSDALSAARG